MGTHALDQAVSAGLPFPSPVHGALLEHALRSEGLDAVVGRGSTAADVAKGLQYVNNDACYETVATVGQALGMIGEGGVRQLVLPKLCAQCRAMDITFFTERALAASGAGRVRVAEVSDVLFADPPELGDVLQEKCAKALLLGDAIVQARTLLAPGHAREAEAACTELDAIWEDRARHAIETNDDGLFSGFWETIGSEIAEAYDPAFSDAPLVALVGSAPIVFDEHMNAGAVKTLEREGCRVRLPFISGQVRWVLDRGPIESPKLRFELGRLRALVANVEAPFSVPPTYIALRSRVEGIVPTELRYGGGWKTAAYFSQLVSEGVRNFIYASTFGCLSGHVLGRGVLKWARSLAPGVNISSIEYDPGTSAVNQANRIKLAASLACGLDDARS